MTTMTTGRASHRGVELTLRVRWWDELDGEGSQAITRTHGMIVEEEWTADGQEITTDHAQELLGDPWFEALGDRAYRAAEQA